MKHNTKNVFGAWSLSQFASFKLSEQVCITSLEHAGLTENFLATCKKTKYTGMLQACSRQLVTCRRYPTCWKNLLRVCWSHQPCYKIMITTCSRLVKTGNKQCEHILLTSWVHTKTNN
jgi:hypothetical protein